MTAVTPALWSRAKDIFDAVVSAPPERQAEVIDTLCSGDDTLRRLVAELVRGDRASSGFLESPAWRGSSLEIMIDTGPRFPEGSLVAERFRVIRCIGSGGMGEVYEAKDESFGQTTVAIKTIRAAVVHQAPQMEGQFRQEVSLARKVSHPNVCRINEFFVHQMDAGERVCLLSMEYLHGTSLREHLASEGAPTVPEATRILGLLAEGLAEAHRAGVLHGDFKSANVILAQQAPGSPRPVITDFGLARPLHESSMPLSEHAASGLGGTPSYMAPELLAGARSSPASDVFAFGVVAIETFSARHPFTREHLKTMQLSPVDARQEVIEGALARVPSRLQRVIRKCLAPLPKDRYRDCTELAAAWRSALMLNLSRRALVIGATVTAASGWAAKTLWWPAVQPFSKLGVLPFRPASKADTLLADGFTDHVIAELGRARGLHVTGRYSSFQLRDSADYASIGNKLGVELILTGSFRSNGGAFEVTANLIPASTGKPGWTRTFSQARGAQSMIAYDIAAAVFQLSSFAFVPPARKRSGPGPEAYEKYLIGCYHRNKGRDRDTLVEALKNFSDAVGFESDYAEAWAGIADTSHLLWSNWKEPQTDIRAREAAERALAIENDLPEGHLALAILHQRLDWNWERAAKGFQRALELAPGSSHAHHWYAGLLSDLGYAEQALRHIELARRLDPLAFRVTSASAMLHYIARKYDDAIRIARTALAVEPKYYSLYPYLAASHLEKGETANAMEAYKKAVALAPDDIYVRAHLAYAFFRTGQPTLAKPIAEKLAGEKTPPIYMAIIDCGAGEKESALKWLSLGFEEREPSMTLAKVHPALDPIRGENYYHEIISGMRLDSPLTVIL